MREKPVTPNSEKGDIDNNIDNIINFIAAKKINGNELRSAYELAMNIAENKEGEQPPREEIYQLAKLIQEKINSGTAINKFAELIVEKEAYDNSPETCKRLINNLQISKKEKVVLRSIIDNSRTGTLTIRVEVANLEHKEDFDIVSEKGKGEEARKEIAANLIKILDQYKGLKKSRDNF